MEIDKKLISRLEHLARLKLSEEERLEIMKEFKQYFTDGR